MIVHIVMWKMKAQADGCSGAENAAKLVQRLEALKEDIKEVSELHAGLNINPSPAAADVALYSVFSTKEELEAYQQHPTHQQLVAWLPEITAERSVVDYER